jgi:DNA-binding IscR family transcriptional regulator
MHLSKKAEYALRATIHLGIAHELGLATVAGSDLAEANKLPVKFVERILQEHILQGIPVKEYTFAQNPNFTP